MKRPLLLPAGLTSITQKTNGMLVLVKTSVNLRRRNEYNKYVCNNELYELKVVGTLNNVKIY